VLLDFQADLQPKEKKTYILRPAKPSAAASSPVRVSESAEALTVDTGKVKFLISREKPFGLFSSVSAGGVNVVSSGEISYVDGFDGGRYVAGKPSSLVVEYAGPMRVTVCAKGRFTGDDRNKFGYVARITAWAGRSDVHVKYSLSNSNPDHYCYRKVRDSTIELIPASKPEIVVLGAGEPVKSDGDSWMQQSARVVSAVAHGSDSVGASPWYGKTPGAAGPGGAKAMSGDRDLWTSRGKGDVAQGWIAARWGGAGVWAADLYFVEDPPRKLALANGRIRLTGVTEPLESANLPFCSGTRWLFDCSRLSSQYLIDFAPSPDAAVCSARAAAAKGRLLALAAPAWYFETGQLPTSTFGTLSDELKCYGLWGWKYDAKDAPAAPGGKFPQYRMGRWCAGDDNHFTSEQDTADGFVLMYLRTGGRAFFDIAEAWINYFEDLQTWRTDGWQWKDGGGWWAKRGKGGPLGNRPERAADPVTGVRNYLLKAYDGEPPFTREDGNDMFFLANAKACHCHNWGEGLVEWFCITGDRDAYEAAIDTVEQNIDTQRRAFGKAPGKAASFSRDFTRASFLTHATRLIAPLDPLVVEASDYLAAVYLQRPDAEPRGFPNGPSKADMAMIEAETGPNGVARMKELGIQLDEKTGELVDPKTGARWLPLVHPHTWMFPPLSRAMEIYHRITGNEDALDWLIAYGQAVARVLYQEKHGCLNYSYFLADFPVKGFAWDRTSWDMVEGARTAPGINGYQASFYPDVAARAYELSGEPLLKQRAFDLWRSSTHAGVADPSAITSVGKWVNVYSTHDESVSFSGKTFFIWSHPKQDEHPPEAVKDLKVLLKGDRAVVGFTAPADRGGRAVRYQLKCSATPIVDYEAYLVEFAANREKNVTNWWMARNIGGEPLPRAPGTRESFEVTGLPGDSRCFAICSFDDSQNRSAIGTAVAAGE
jgi:hypothetical protein